MEGFQPSSTSDEILNPNERTLQDEIDDLLNCAPSIPSEALIGTSGTITSSNNSDPNQTSTLEDVPLPPTNIAGLEARPTSFQLDTIALPDDESLRNIALGSTESNSDPNEANSSTVATTVDNFEVPENIKCTTTEVNVEERSTTDSPSIQENKSMYESITEESRTTNESHLIQNESDVQRLSTDIVENKQDQDDDDDILEITVIDRKTTNDSQIHSTSGKPKERHKQDELKFMSNFDPQHSSRQQFKRRKRYCPEEGKLVRYADEYDDCDCLVKDCVGCHYPCKCCGNTKCGGRCRLCD